TRTAVRSMLVFGASQKPRKITLPVTLATNTWPSTRMLIASANPVAKVSNNSAVTVSRSDTGEEEETAMGAVAGPIALQVGGNVQLGDGRHPGHQPAVLITLHDQPVRQVFQ